MPKLSYLKHILFASAFPLVAACGLVKNDIPPTISVPSDKTERFVTNPPFNMQELSGVIDSSNKISPMPLPPPISVQSLSGKREPEDYTRDEFEQIEYRLKGIKPVYVEMSGSMLPLGIELLFENKTGETLIYKSPVQSVATDKSGLRKINFGYGAEICYSSLNIKKSQEECGENVSRDALGDDEIISYDSSIGYLIKRKIGRATILEVYPNENARASGLYPANASTVFHGRPPVTVYEVDGKIFVSYDFDQDGTSDLIDEQPSLSIHTLGN